MPRGKLDLLVASPEFIHFSKTRSGRPKNDQSRASAWHVLRCSEALYIRNILMEGYPLDILLRMLCPHELAAAQSFPKTYAFLGTRKTRVKLIGNAVPPDMAEALCYANVRSLIDATHTKRPRRGKRR